MTTLAQVQAQILAAAVSQLGVPYVFGGETPGVGFDCSGLTQWCCDQAGILLPRGSADQFNLSPYQVTDGSFEVADLVFFHGAETSPPYPGHVGIVSDPSTLTMIQAPFTGQVVSYSPFDPTVTVGFAQYFGSTRPALILGPFAHTEDDDMADMYICTDAPVGNSAYMSNLLQCSSVMPIDMETAMNTLLAPLGRVHKGPYWKSKLAHLPTLKLKP